MQILTYPANSNDNTMLVQIQSIYTNKLIINKAGASLWYIFA